MKPYEKYLRIHVETENGIDANATLCWKKISQRLFLCFSRTKQWRHEILNKSLYVTHTHIWFQFNEPKKFDWSDYTVEINSLER